MKDVIDFAQFAVCYIQVKNNKVMGSGNLKGDGRPHPLYTGDHFIQVKIAVNIRHDFREDVW